MLLPLGSELHPQHHVAKSRMKKPVSEGEGLKGTAFQPWKPRVGAHEEINIPCNPSSLPG